MDLAAIAIFVDVMRRGSFASVARERNLAASSISRSIAALEGSLGAPLFERETGEIIPTEAAVAYYERLAPLLEELERVSQLGLDGAEALRGPLRVTAPLAFARLNLTPLLPEFARQHPGVSFELLLTDKVLDLLEERIDVAVRVTKFIPPELVSFRLCKVADVVCASPAYVRRQGRPRAPADLGRHECLRYGAPHQGTRWRFRPVGGGDASEVQVRGRVVASSAEALRQCAVAAMGVALLPRWVAARELVEGSLVELLPGYEAASSEFDLAAWAVYPPARYVPRKVRAFVDFLERRFRHGAPAEAEPRGVAAAEDAP
jgi:DNA-binding transcriptional LysR family regulator